MSNIDKHQKLYVARAHTTRPRITYEPPGVYRIAKTKWVPERTTLDPGAEICKLRRATIGKPPPGTEMQLSVNGKVFLAFRQPGKSIDVATSPDLSLIFNYTRAVVLAFTSL